MTGQGPISWLYAQLREQLGLKVTHKQIRRDYRAIQDTTLLQIQEQLADWNVKSMGVSLTPDQLDKIPLPAVAHMKEANGEFFVLTGVNNDSVTYLRYLHGALSRSG